MAHPRTTDAGRPLLLVSGDDNGTVTMLTPRSQAPDDWTYDATRVATGSGTVGSVAVGDANGDGWTDVVVPMYADNRVDLYTFAPAPPAAPAVLSTAQ